MNDDGAQTRFAIASRYLGPEKGRAYAESRPASAGVCRTAFNERSASLEPPRHVALITGPRVYEAIWYATVTVTPISTA